MSNRVFIVWSRYHRRSELLADHLGATLHYIYDNQKGQLRHLPIRYLAQAFQTWGILRREQPDIIFVQNPPIFAVLVVAIYARYHGARYVIDSHTGAFHDRKWRWSVGLLREISRGALATIVHNPLQEKIVNRWGCRYYVLDDPVRQFDGAEKFSFAEQFNAVVVSSFGPDEPLEILFGAVAGLPTITFYVTGDYSRADSALLSKKPDNCRLTGYIPYSQYMGLLEGANVIIDLVTNGDTLLCGAFEAVSVGTPLIVSDWPILRECFPIGTVFVSNTIHGVREGVNRALREQSQMRQEMLLLREQHQVAWMHKFRGLQRLLSEN